MLPEQIVGTCTCCDDLTTISINESYGVCSLCGAKDRVIFTSYQHEARPRNPCYLERSLEISMPKMPCLQYGASGSTRRCFGTNAPLCLGYPFDLCLKRCKHSKEYSYSSSIQVFDLMKTQTKKIHTPIIEYESFEISEEQYYLFFISATSSIILISR